MEPLEETKRTTESEDDTEETGKRKGESEELPEESARFGRGRWRDIPSDTEESRRTTTNRDAARNEKGEEQPSVVKAVTKKTFIQTPITVEEPVKKINFENKTPEPEEGDPRTKSTSGVCSAARDPGRVGERNSSL